MELHDGIGHGSKTFDVELQSVGECHVRCRVLGFALCREADAPRAVEFNNATLRLYVQSHEGSGHRRAVDAPRLLEHAVP